MGRNILFLVFTCFYSWSLYAQEKSETVYEQRAQYITDELCRKITVTTDMKENLAIVFRLYFEDIETYHAEGNDPLMKALVQTRDSNIKDVLSNEVLFNEYQEFIEVYKSEKKRQGNTQQGRSGSLKKENN